MNNYTEILNRHSKAVAGHKEFERLVSKGYAVDVIEAVTRAMEEVEKKTNEEFADLSEVLHETIFQQQELLSNRPQVSEQESIPKDYHCNIKQFPDQLELCGECLKGKTAPNNKEETKEDFIPANGHETPVFKEEQPKEETVKNCDDKLYKDYIESGGLAKQLNQTPPQSEKEEVTKSAEEFLKEKGIHPTEPIYWDLEKRQISLDELMEEYKNQSTPKINLKELREKFVDWANELFNKENREPSNMEIFNYLVTELKLK